MVSMIFIIYLPKLSHLFPVLVQFNSPCITTLYIRATLIVLRGILNLHLKLNYATTLKPLFICFCCNKLFWGVCTINYSMVFYWMRMRNLSIVLKYKISHNTETLFILLWIANRILQIYLTAVKLSQFNMKINEWFSVQLKKSCHRRDAILFHWCTNWDLDWGKRKHCSPLLIILSPPILGGA